MKYLVFGTNSYVRKIEDDHQYCVIGALGKSTGINFIGIEQKSEIEELLRNKEECAIELRKRFKFKTSFLTSLQRLNDNATERMYASATETRVANWKALSRSLRKKNLYNKVKKYAIREVECD